MTILLSRKLYMRSNFATMSTFFPLAYLPHVWASMHTRQISLCVLFICTFLPACGIETLNLRGRTSPTLPSCDATTEDCHQYSHRHPLSEVYDLGVKHSSFILDTATGPTDIKNKTATFATVYFNPVKSTYYNLMTAFPAPTIEFFFSVISWIISLKIAYWVAKRITSYPFLDYNHCKFEGGSKQPMCLSCLNHFHDQLVVDSIQIGRKPTYQKWILMPTTCNSCSMWPHRVLKPIKLLASSKTTDPEIYYSALMNGSDKRDGHTAMCSAINGDDKRGWEHSWLTLNIGKITKMESVYHKYWWSICCPAFTDECNYRLATHWSPIPHQALVQAPWVPKDIDPEWKHPWAPPPPPPQGTFAQAIQGTPAIPGPTAPPAPAAAVPSTVIINGRIVPLDVNTDTYNADGSLIPVDRVEDSQATGDNTQPTAPLDPGISAPVPSQGSTSSSSSSVAPPPPLPPPPEAPPADLAQTGETEVYEHGPGPRIIDDNGDTSSALKRMRCFYQFVRETRRMPRIFPYLRLEDDFKVFLSSCPDFWQRPKHVTLPMSYVTPNKEGPKDQEGIEMQDFTTIDKHIDQFLPCEFDDPCPAITEAGKRHGLDIVYTTDARAVPLAGITQQPIIHATCDSQGVAAAIQKRCLPSEFTDDDQKKLLDKCDIRHWLFSFVDKYYDADTKRVVSKDQPPREWRPSDGNMTWVEGKLDYEPDDLHGDERLWGEGWNIRLMKQAQKEGKWLDVDISKMTPAPRRREFRRKSTFGKRFNNLCYKNLNCNGSEPRITESFQAMFGEKATLADIPLSKFSKEEVERAISQMDMWLWTNGKKDPFIMREVNGKNEQVIKGGPGETAACWKFIRGVYNNKIELAAVSQVVGKILCDLTFGKERGLFWHFSVKEGNRPEMIAKFLERLDSVPSKNQCLMEADQTSAEAHQRTNGGQLDHIYRFLNKITQILQDRGCFYGYEWAKRYKIKLDWDQENGLCWTLNPKRGFKCPKITVKFPDMYLDSGAMITSVSNFINGLFTMMCAMYVNPNHIFSTDADGHFHVMKGTHPMQFKTVKIWVPQQIKTRNGEYTKWTLQQPIGHFCPCQEGDDHASSNIKHFAHSPNVAIVEWGQVSAGNDTKVKGIEQSGGRLEYIGVHVAVKDGKPIVKDYDQAWCPKVEGLMGKLGSRSGDSEGLAEAISRNASLSGMCANRLPTFADLFQGQVERIVKMHPKIVEASFVVKPFDDAHRAGFRAGQNSVKGLLAWLKEINNSYNVMPEQEKDMINMSLNEQVDSDNPKFTLQDFHSLQALKMVANQQDFMYSEEWWAVVPPGLRG